jgi:hypothetical protein
MPDDFTIAHRVEITSLAARYRLPAVYPLRFFAELGGLLSYGNDLLDNFRRAATYADRILKGAKPSELPVQAPVKFELVINLKTAKALGLDVPLHLQQRADEVTSEATRVIPPPSCPAQAGHPVISAGTRETRCGGQQVAHPHERWLLGRPPKKRAMTARSVARSSPLAAPL